MSHWIWVALLSLWLVARLISLYISRKQKSETKYIWTVKHAYPLPLDEIYDFDFWISFGNKDDADACVHLVTYPGLTARTELTPNGKRWAVTWEIRERADVVMYRTILDRIGTTAKKHGNEKLTLIPSACKAGSKVGFFLEGVQIIDCAKSVQPSVVVAS